MQLHLQILHFETSYIIIFWIFYSPSKLQYNDLLVLAFESGPNKVWT